MMKMNKSQNMNEMMSKMSESEKTMMMGMCMCQDCGTMKDCSMNMDCSKTSSMTSCMDPAMTYKMGLFCSMEGKMMMPCEPQKMECMCPSCPVASDMGMAMTSPCMGKK